MEAAASGPAPDSANPTRMREFQVTDNYPGTKVWEPKCHKQETPREVIQLAKEPQFNEADLSVFQQHLKSCEELVLVIVKKHFSDQPEGPDYQRIRLFLNTLISPSSEISERRCALTPMESEIVQVLFHNMAVQLAHTHMSLLRTSLDGEGLSK